MAYNTGSGALVEIASTTLVSPASTIAISSIPATYSKIFVECLLRTDKAATVDTVRVQFNADTGANYDNGFTWFAASATSYSGQRGQTSGFVGSVEAASSLADSFSVTSFDIPFYANTDSFKTFYLRSSIQQDNNADADLNRYSGFSKWESKVAIGSLLLINDGADDFIAGCKVVVHGVV